MEYLSGTDATDRRKPLSKAEVIREWHRTLDIWIFGPGDEVVARDPRASPRPGGRSPPMLSKTGDGCHCVEGQTSERVTSEERPSWAPRPPSHRYPHGSKVHRDGLAQLDESLRTCPEAKPTVHEHGWLF